jgi:hypothetical protein
MQTALAIVISVVLVGAYMRAQHQDKVRREARRWKPPRTTGVIQLRRPFTMDQRKWEQILSDHKAAGWRIVASNSLVNQMTLEK